jgi:hypothetical protein
MVENPVEIHFNWWSYLMYLYTSPPSFFILYIHLSCSVISVLKPSVKLHLYPSGRSVFEQGAATLVST